MIVARGLYQRFRHLIHECAKFGVIGGIAFVVTFVGTGLLNKKAGLGIVTSSTIATIVATFVSYVGNRYWTFRARERGGVSRETILFFALNGVGLAIQETFVAFNKYVLGFRGDVSNYTALVIGVAFATVFRFWAYRKWVWGPPLAAASPVGTPPGAYEERQPATVPPGPVSPGPAGGAAGDEAGRSR